MSQTCLQTFRWFEVTGNSSTTWVVKRREEGDQKGGDDVAESITQHPPRLGARSLLQRHQAERPTDAPELAERGASILCVVFRLC